MNKFEKQLEKWNNGILRGAQAKLAKCLQVTTATVALWATGKRHPSKGYVAQMARLFSIDLSAAQRLFSADTPRTDVDTPFSWVLRDHSDDKPAYSPADTDLSITLPVFTKMPPTYPRFFSKEARHWWTLPQKIVNEARFVFVLPGPNDPKRLLLVKPFGTWKTGDIVLVQYEHGYRLALVTKAAKTILLKGENGEKIPGKNVIPFGVVTRQICQLKFTP